MIHFINIYVEKFESECKYSIVSPHPTENCRSIIGLNLLIEDYTGKSKKQFVYPIWKVLPVQFLSVFS